MTGPQNASALERILSRIEIDPNGCWIWPGAKSGNGYGKVQVRPRLAYVHRVTYEACIGPVPKGLDLDHLCRVRACCNPDHLEPVTRRENLLRGDTLPAKAVAQTHCKWGHELTPENVYRQPSKPGTRACRACGRRRANERGN